MPQQYDAYPLGHGLTALVCKDLRPEGNDKGPLKLYRNQIGEITNTTNVTIQQASGYDDGGYYPAECTMLKGMELIKLRDALVKEFPLEAVLNPMPLLKVIPHLQVSLRFPIDDKFDKDFVAAIGRDINAAGYEASVETLPSVAGVESSTWVQITAIKR